MCSAWFDAASQRKKHFIVLLLVVAASFIISGAVFIDIEQLKGVLLLVVFFTTCILLVHVNQCAVQKRLMKKSLGYPQRKRLEQRLSGLLDGEVCYSVRNPDDSVELHATKVTGLFGLVTYYVWFEDETFVYVDDESMRNVYMRTTETYRLSSDLAVIDVEVETSWKVGSRIVHQPEDSWEYEMDACELIDVFHRMHEAFDLWVPSSVS